MAIVPMKAEAAATEQGGDGCDDRGMTREQQIIHHYLDLTTKKLAHKSRDDEHCEGTTIIDEVINSNSSPRILQQPFRRRCRRCHRHQ
jgi:hypothetical protein